MGEYAFFFIEKQTITQKCVVKKSFGKVFSKTKLASFFGFFFHLSHL